MVKIQELQVFLLKRFFPVILLLALDIEQGTVELRPAYGKSGKSLCPAKGTKRFEILP